MTDLLDHWTAQRGGVITRTAAFAAGYSAAEVDRAVARGEWVRLRRGAYTESFTWNAASAAQRNVLGLRALSLQLEPALVVDSHQTAAAALGLELWEPTYDYVHVTRAGDAGRREGVVWHHRAGLPATDVTTVSGLHVTTALRSALDVARSSDFEHGVVAVDSALRLTAGDSANLLELQGRCLDWPGSRAGGRAVAFADARAGSVGESRARVHLHLAGVPAPQTQVNIYAPDGRFVAQVDFLLREKVVLEFDGRIKYGLDGLDADAMATCLWLEKQREDALRRLGYEVDRIVWADFYLRGRVGVLGREAMARAEQTGPVRGTQSLVRLRGSDPVGPDRTVARPMRGAD